MWSDILEVVLDSLLSVNWSSWRVWLVILVIGLIVVAVAVALGW